MTLAQARAYGHTLWDPIPLELERNALIINSVAASHSEVIIEPEIQDCSSFDDLPGRRIGKFLGTFQASTAEQAVQRIKMMQHRARDRRMHASLARASCLSKTECYVVRAIRTGVLPFRS